MTTPRDLITLALYDAGVVGTGQTPSAEDINLGLKRLNMMIAQWARKRWLVYHLIDTGLTSTGAVSYSVGTGGDYNITRPDRLEAAYLRQTVQSQPNQIDYPLRLLQSMEDYIQIGLKQLQSFPQYVFYDSGYPMGTLYPWPVPQASIYAVHILTKAVLSGFTTAQLSDDIVLPPEYEAAILYNLIVRYCAAYTLPQDPTNVALAKDSLDVLRGANAQIAKLKMPTGLVRRGIYNPYSDRNQ